MREHEKELEMVADEWRDEVGEARAQVEELKDVSLLSFCYTSVSQRLSTDGEFETSKSRRERRSIRARSRVAGKKK